jgi:Xaa-Pro aminopeptidase
MNFNNAKVSMLCALVILLLNANLPVAGGEHFGEVSRSSVIRKAPPAPTFDEKTRLAELAGRRARVAGMVGSKGILILFSTEPRVYANDVNYEYRQENNLYYLTNLEQKRATLVMMPGNEATPEVLFLPRRSPAAETWTGHMYSPEEASQISGVREIWEASEFEPFLNALRNRQPYWPKPEKILMSSQSSPARAQVSGFEKLFDSAGKNDALLYMLVPGMVDSLEYRQEQRFASEWVKARSGYTVKDATPFFVEMRLQKSPLEIALLQHAIDITIEAQERSWIAAGDAKWEYEVDAQVAYTFKLRNADHWGYPSIVGCGPNATTLHYQESQGQVKSGELLLMDVGAEYKHYSADVTRTFPVSGRFSPAQTEIYRIVYDALEAGAKVARPGALKSDVHRAATEVIKDGLLKLGLIVDRDSDQYRLWFMHGTSHWLGMNVHDVGELPGRAEPRLAAGMVFTNEPGIYIRPDALDNLPKTSENQKLIAAIKPAFEKYKGIGVRIEDDMLITPGGVKWLTEALPRKISEIEDFIARGRQEASR